MEKWTGIISGTNRGLVVIDFDMTDPKNVTGTFVLYDIENETFEAVEKNPYAPNEDIFPVAAFNSPGHVVSAVSGYRETGRAEILPLFSYGAVGWCGEVFRSAAVLVDPEPRQDLRQMKRSDVIRSV